MFDKFGEFDSCEEINRAAEAQKAEGDLEALRELAKENGLDPEDAEDFFYGPNNEDNIFCWARAAAIGKIEVEKKELKLEREFEMLTEELVKTLTEESLNGQPKIALGVRRKGKRLAEYLAKVIDRGYEQAVTPPKEILQYVKAVPSQYKDRMKTGMPDKATRREIMQTYYCEEVTG